MNRREFLIALSVGPAILPARSGRIARPTRDADIDYILPSLSNWGRWGTDDQLGTLNFITPERRVAAARLVRAGRSISLARQTALARDPGVRRGAHEIMKSEDGARDFIAMVFHGFAITHLDSLNHAFASPKAMYNGVPTDSTKLGVETVAKQGVTGRGVLLDLGPREPGSAIFPADLEAVERAQRVRVEEGDILLVRTGAGARNTRELRAGLHPQCLPWIHKRRIALLGSDGDNDAHPVAGFERWASSMHSVGIPHMGLHLLDNAELDALAAACRAERRWEFLFVLAPLRIEGATGSPVNPIALL